VVMVVVVVELTSKFYEILFTGKYLENMFGCNCVTEMTNASRMYSYSIALNTS